MDIALVMGEFGGDVVVNGLDLERDDGLETAVVISLFTDRRATAEQVPVELPQDDLRGFWGDVRPVVEGDQTGSLLWLLAREKQLPSTLSRAKQYCTEALVWLIEDQVSSRVEVATEYVATGWMGIAIDIYRPDSQPVRYRYNYEWKAQVAKRAA